MIDRIKIQNFKSIVDLKFNPGSFNVIIGPNGCGKSNILEAISFASAASQNKLDYEYLVNRDERMSEPKFMFNAFDDEEDAPTEDNDDGSKKINAINIAIDCSDTRHVNKIIYLDEVKRWIDLAFMANRGIYEMLKTDKDLAVSILKPMIESSGEKVYDVSDVEDLIKSFATKSTDLERFLVYRPTEHFLRKTFDTSIFPLGVHGEGLLKYLKEMAEERNSQLFDEINNGLSLLDWFDGFMVPENLMSDEYRLSIGDGYLKDSLHYFDQRSTNEGFLFMLFYLTLFNSHDMPRFFAVDNIESALNPKLLTRLINYLVERTIAGDKQVIVTTHSPFVLDALDLEDDRIRLFVARRDIDGHTRLERVPYRKDRKMKLSQLWMSGLIGGLPDNF